SGIAWRDSTQPRRARESPGRPIPRSCRGMSSRALDRPRSQMAVEPLLRPPDRVERVRALERHVALARIHDELDLRTALGERVEQLLGLADRRTSILRALEDQRRRRASGRERDRRALGVLARGIVPLTLED